MRMISMLAWLGLGRLHEHEASVRSSRVMKRIFPVSLFHLVFLGGTSGKGKCAEHRFLTMLHTRRHHSADHPSCRCRGARHCATDGIGIESLK